MSQAEYDSVWNTDQGGTAYKVQADPSAPGLVRLWDVVDEGWTKPFKEYEVMKRLQMVVDKCSHCTFVGVHRGEVDRHLVQVQEDSEGHYGAEMRDKANEQGRVVNTECTACGAGFRPERRRAGVHHIQERLQAASLHRGATVILNVRRFSLEPRELPKPYASGGRPDDIQVEEESRRGRRNRRRGRRSRASDNHN